jgi:hypothetical protein
MPGVRFLLFAEREMQSIRKFLIAASLPFFLDTAFEMYLLTPAQGPQMLFFSLAHIAPVLLLLVSLSGIAFACLMVFALVIVVLNLVGVLNTESGYARMMLIILLVQAAHTALFLTYDRWSAALSG